MRCPSCKAQVTPVPPRTSAKIALVGFWIAAMVISTLFSLALGLNIVLVPAAIAVGSAVGVAARRAGSWTCPRCKEELVVVTEPLAAPARPERPLVPQTA